MNWGRVLVYAVLVSGAVGYPLCFIMWLRLRLWLGKDAPPWPRIALLAILLLLFGMGWLFFNSLFRQLHVLRGVPYSILNLASAVYASLVPWLVIGGLHRWRRVAERGGRVGAIPD